MANSYLTFSFAVPANQAQFELFEECVEAYGEIYENGEDGEDAHGESGSWYESRSPEFKKIFDSPDKFKESFDEFNYNIAIDASFQNKYIYISADEYGNPNDVGEILRHVVPDALPFGFEWALTCSKPRVDEFGGGVTLVTQDGVRSVGTLEMLDKMLSEETVKRNGAPVNERVAEDHLPDVDQILSP